MKNDFDFDFEIPPFPPVAPQKKLTKAERRKENMERFGQSTRKFLSCLVYQISLPLSQEIANMQKSQIWWYIWDFSNVAKC